MEKERTNALEVATKTYEERKSKETETKVLDLSKFISSSTKGLHKVTLLGIPFNFNTAKKCLKNTFLPAWKLISKNANNYQIKGCDN